ncbi:uncharacterized protein F4807DRAFT_417539 [Annulohypoxylon truncatum]|uniref:uncharacterized protein n=1 Tax=Annulohypoxylon truncatum TaxID=327061 RepID=UPI002007D985|nr:uncharacterized protein F4807DRAFT_417539 [Annulohypoxylon truncatum]KAI1212096.1 hypothetical protein F4807DRAFT_417539 [Annulohypoxylon truncatum]
MDATNIPTGLHHRMPIVFGPFPGPRQSFDGHRRDGSSTTSKEAFVTFKTPKSAVSSLLPPGFSFQDTSSPDECAYVTVAPKRLDNLEWLGYRGYNLFSFFIHGIQYTTPQGITRKGTYLPVLWEDLADPIISGREELGFPKLFADISISETQGIYRMSASWMGSRFVDLSLDNLHEVEGIATPLAPPEAGIDDGTLLYRHMPTPGNPGVSEVDYPVFVSYAEERKMQPVSTVRRFVGSTGEVIWHPLDWQSLPTLHHIVKRLADIPVTSIVKCGLTEKVGNSDLSSARNANI